MSKEEPEFSEADTARQTQREGGEREGGSMGEEAGEGETSLLQEPPPA